MGKNYAGKLVRVGSAGRNILINIKLSATGINLELGPFNLTKIRRNNSGQETEQENAAKK